MNLKKCSSRIGYIVILFNLVSDIIKSEYENICF